MRKQIKLLLIVFLATVGSTFAQDEYVVNQTKYTQKINTSYFGMN